MMTDEVREIRKRFAEACIARAIYQACRTCDGKQRELALYMQRFANEKVVKIEG